MKKLIPAVAGFAILIASATASGAPKKSANLAQMGQDSSSQKNQVGGSGSMGTTEQGGQMGQGSQGSMGQSGQMGQAGSMGGMQQLQGVVKSYDKNKNQLTIQLPVSPNATIMKNGQMARSSDIKNGEEVRASYDTATGNIVSLDLQGKASDKDKDKNKEKSNQGGSGMNDNSSGSPSGSDSNRGTEGSNY